MHEGLKAKSLINSLLHKQLPGDNVGFLDLVKGDALKTRIRKHHKDREGLRDFPAGPVVKTPHSQCCRHRFNTWSGN